MFSLYEIFLKAIKDKLNVIIGNKKKEEAIPVKLVDNGGKEFWDWRNIPTGGGGGEGGITKEQMIEALEGADIENGITEI